MKKKTSRKKQSEKDKVRRIGEGFHKELEEIKNARKKSGIDKKKKLANGKITNMIPKHKHWPKIREDLINYEFKE